MAQTLWSTCMYILPIFRFRYVCPVESECIVTIGRVWPIVEEAPPKISNETEKEEAEKVMGKYEGKNFIKRSCVSKAKLNDQSCKSFPSKSNFGINTCFSKLSRLILISDFNETNAEVYQCNICDTESCNSWGARSMPDSNHIIEDKISGWRIFGIICFVLFAIAISLYCLKQYCC